MKPATLEFHHDHLALKLEGVHAAEAMRRAIVVPYSTIGNAEVQEPEWPGLVDHYQVGSFLPGVLARGTFVEWSGRRRFLDIGRDTKRALTIKLSGHPEFDEVTVDLPDPGAALDQVARHKTIAPAIPPVME